MGPPSRRRVCHIPVVYGARVRPTGAPSRASAGPAHVLLTFEDYQKLAGSEGSIIEQLGQPDGIEDVELVVPRLRDIARPADPR